jgi:hypothetical protein
VAADAISEGIMMLVFGETSEGAEGPEHDAVEEDGANLESS